MSGVLTKCVLQVAPLLHLANMPAQMLGDEQATKMRLDFIKQFISQPPEGNIVKNTNNYFFEPFALEEVSIEPTL